MVTDRSEQHSPKFVPTLVPATPMIILPKGEIGIKAIQAQAASVAGVPSAWRI